MAQPVEIMPLEAAQVGFPPAWGGVAPTAPAPARRLPASQACWARFMSAAYSACRSFSLRARTSSRCRWASCVILRLLLLPLGLAFVGLRHLHLPEHACEAKRCYQHHRGAQAGDQRVAPAPTPQPLQRADTSGLNRLVGEVAAQVLGQVVRRKRSAAVGLSRSLS